METIEKEVRIEAPIQTVWSYLEDPNLLAAWLMRNDFEPRSGREFCFYGPPTDTWDGVLHCRVVECDPPHRLSFTWNANDIGFETLVAIDLVSEGKGTKLRLSHSGFRADVPGGRDIAERHNRGWSHHLAVLRNQLAEVVDPDRKAPGPIDWTEFRLYVAIDAAPERLLRAWSTIEGMESFFVAMMRITDPDGSERQPDEVAGAGDRFVWRWHNSRSLSGRYLDVDPRREVSFTFGDSCVRVQARAHGKGALLELCQYGMPDTPEANMHVYVNCRAAWVYFLTTLKARLEYNVDVRDKAIETGGSFSTFFDPRSVGFEPEATPAPVRG
jgi:uncharacterized protein YndB with AHSA1/START domain